MKKYITKLCFSILIVITTLYVNTLVENYFLNKAKIENIKKDKLSFIQKQLDLFYMPLKRTLHKSKISWQDYMRYYGNEEIYMAIQSGKTNSETLRWQRYMLSVFQPLHFELSTILKNRQLVLKYSVLNPKLDELNTHIDQYIIIFSQWKDNDISKNISISKFPQDIEEIVNDDIRVLNKEMSRIIESKENLSIYNWLLSNKR